MLLRLSRTITILWASMWERSEEHTSELQTWLHLVCRLLLDKKDKVKIDRMFVADAPEDREQGAIISAIVALAHALDIEVIGEGVENQAQQDFLRRCGCDYIQGYLVGQPADADTAAKEYL